MANHSYRGRNSTRPIDGVLFDLDGVVYHGAEAVRGAVDAINSLHHQRVPVNYVTNNASRTPEVVAEHISALGIPTSVDEITTSAQVLAANLREEYGAGARVLMLGSAGLSTALTNAGLSIVDSLDDRPHAFAQGLDPNIDYSAIVAACRAIRTGLDWWASNPDYSMPGPDGQVPGNGAFVDVISRLTGSQPTTVGKPSPHMMLHAATQLNLNRPLMVGDRLDTDIEGGQAAGFDSALVLTGVHDLHDALAAAPGQRPDFILPSLTTLDTLIASTEPASTNPGTTTPATTNSEDPHLGDFVRIVDGRLSIDESVRHTIRGVQTALRLAWAAYDQGQSVAPGDLPRRIDD